MACNRIQSRLTDLEQRVSEFSAGADESPGYLVIYDGETRETLRRHRIQPGVMIYLPHNGRDELRPEGLQDEPATGCPD